MREKIIEIIDVNHHFNQDDIFYNLSATILSKDKVGLIGQNGSGKTTLLKMILGQIKPYRGAVRVFTESVGYIPQMVQTETQATVLNLYDFCMSLNKGIFEEYCVLRDFEKGISTDQEHYLHMLGEFHEKGGYDFQGRVNNLLKISGFTDQKLDQKFYSLSEGQKRLVYLIAMLALQKEMLLLDEPTNHVDTELKQKYIQLISDYDGTVLVITHDREVLSSTCTKILELKDKSLESYDGNWEMYKRESEKRQREKIRRYTLDTKELARQEDLLDRVYKGEANLSEKAAKSRVKRARNKLTKVMPELERKELKGDMTYDGKYSNYMLRLKDFTMNIDSRSMIRDLDLDVHFGDKIAITGSNGTGKSTLFKLILGTCRYAGYTGEIIIGESAEIGYFSQTLEFGDSDQTLFEFVRDHFKSDRTRTYGLLARYMYSKQQSEQKIYELSGGEKNRLQLMQLMEGNYNLLLLDEPTNHLDIYALEKLEQLLQQYNGTLLLISHDRYFVDAVAVQELDLNDYT